MDLLKNTGSETDRPVELRKMERSDMESLMRMKDAEGWNQTEKDWELLIHYPESVNLVAVQDDRIIGTVTAINYAHRVAWIGMMLVDKDFRGRGISKLLLNETIRKLARCASVKLDATPAGRPVYLKLGFQDEYILHRMTHPAVSKISPGPGTPEAVQVMPGDLPDLAEFDRRVFGAGRTPLIRHLYKNHPGIAWLIRENNKVAGYCLGREGVKYTQIGPVYGSSETIAKALIRAAINTIAGKAVVVDIHATRTGLIRWLEGHGFTTQRSFDRMFLHNNPHPGLIEYQYLICGPELG